VSSEILTLGHRLW